MEKEFLNIYHSQAQHESTDPGAQSVCERDQLAYQRSCSLKGRLLIKHTSKDYFPKTLEARHYLLFSLCSAPEHQYLLEGSSCTCLCPSFYIWCPGFCVCCPGDTL